MTIVLNLINKNGKAISGMMILYLPYVKPSQDLNEGNQNKLSGGVTYKAVKIAFKFINVVFILVNYC